MTEQSEPTVEQIHFTQHIRLSVERWPERTAFAEDWLEAPHVHQATIDPAAQTVTFEIESGSAVYALRRDLDRWGGAVVADLIEEIGPRGGVRRVRATPPPRGEAEDG